MFEELRFGVPHEKGHVRIISGQPKTNPLQLEVDAAAAVWCYFTTSYHMSYILRSPRMYTERWVSVCISVVIHKIADARRNELKQVAMCVRTAVLVMNAGKEKKTVAEREHLSWPLIGPRKIFGRVGFLERFFVRNRGEG